MAARLTPRYELFAQGLAKGLSAIAAYTEAGYKPDGGNAARLQQNDKIVQRVAEILALREKTERLALERAIEKLAITKERVLEELAKIGFANMQDYMRTDHNGDPVLDFSALTRDQAAALAEVTVEKTKLGAGTVGDVTRIKFKLHDKKGALVDIGKHLGMFKETLELNAAVNITIAGQDAALL